MKDLYYNPIKVYQEWEMFDPIQHVRIFHESLFGHSLYVFEDIEFNEEV